MVAGGLGQSGSQVSERRVVETLDEILARPEFEQQGSYLEELLSDFFLWLGEFLDGLGVGMGDAGVEAWTRTLGVIVAISSGVGLIWFLIVIFRSRSAQREKETAQLPEAVARRVSKLRKEAQAAQERGDLTRALRLYFFALVVGLGERGELEYSDAWTNRELLERGEPDASIAKLLRPLVTELDEHSFGQRPTKASEVKVFAELCEDLLGEGVV